MSRIARSAVLIAAATMLLPATPAGARKHRQSNEQKAIQAVKREIARKYPLLNATSPVVNTDHTHVLVTCERASKTRFTCDWRASNELHDRAEGSARVVVYRKGAQATLYNTRCTNEITGTCA